MMCPVWRWCAVWMAVVLSAVAGEPGVGGEFIAVLIPYQEAVVSARVSSVVGEYRLKDGDAAAKNAVIVELDTAEFLPLKEKAEAVYQESVTQRNYYRKIYDGNLELFQKGLLGEQELAKSKLDWELAVAREKTAIADLRLTSFNVVECSIRMPFDGKLAERLCKAHEFVRAGMPLVSVIDDSKVYAVAFLPLELRSRLRLGEPLWFLTDEQAMPLEGKIAFLAPRGDATSGNFELRLLLDNADGKLLPGMSGVIRCR
ncbi:efflux RND transporter periplasmic adaptor subunit [Victivallis sp. Marseille-Q1083]|uniref:efflux RND transporter periplasmic adaptor subunit n=1 Tax=Victivallis sp. Marseille-Q1083 TaxID=2717288 RepID=UPI001589923A|nr:efflux RND transporter periplasmic adaptor subunit [Victivallis sp. Marseille-Q1083]